MSESNQSGDKRNGAVGYGRPPVNRQFKPGQSGNPRGRPKGSKNLATMFAEALNEKMKVRTKDGRTRTLSKQELMVEVMINNAMAGDTKAFATVVQFMDKYEVFRRLTVDHDELAASAVEHLRQRLVGLAGRPPEKQESTPQEES
jgi:hypothetical protein